uniref:C-type lectin domain family 4 member M-like n=1 Tax=Sinocyclocheilus anshuiensis TaxID=1608454 RepID=A0A671P636_9TELE
MNSDTNADTIKSHDVRTGTANQTPQYTGTETHFIRIPTNINILVILVFINSLLLGIRNSGCLENGWLYSNFSFYFISSLKKTLNESKSYCMERGADLIIINDREEQDFAKKVSRGNEFWIGLTDSDEEGRWKWVDGSTLTSGFWGSGEPNGQRGENCVVSYPSGWYDYPCNDAFRWICDNKIF